MTLYQLLTGFFSACMFDKFQTDPFALSVALRLDETFKRVTLKGMKSRQNTQHRSAAEQRRREDQYWLNKSKRRIQISLVFAFAVIFLWPLAMYFVLAQPLFPKPSYFNVLYLMVFLVELIVWLLIFLWASSGNRASRYVYTLALIAEFVFSAWLVYDMFSHMNYIPFYLAWFILSIVKNSFLSWFRGWLYGSWSGRIYFEHVMVLPEEARAQERQRELEEKRRRLYEEREARRMRAQAEGSWNQSGDPRDGVVDRHPYQDPSIYNAHIHPGSYSLSDANQPARLQSYAQDDLPDARQPIRQAPASSMQEPDIRSNRQREMLTRQEEDQRQRREISSKYPRAAIRMAAGVYGSLILFPIATHILQNSFVSIDNSSVFAVGLMFTLCILTAVVWTFPIFFYYLKYPGAKKCLYAAAAGQLLILAYGLYSLNVYRHGETVAYADNVFLLFAIFEIVRYAVLIIAVFPAFRLPEIQETWSEPSSRSKRFMPRSRRRGNEEGGMEFELVEEDDDDSDEDENEDTSAIQPQNSDANNANGNVGADDEEYDDEEEDESPWNRLKNRFSSH